MSSGLTGSESIEAPPSEVLTRARELIERGWCQHGFTPGVDKVADVDPGADAFCIQGAIIAALKETGFVDSLYRSVWGTSAMNYMEAQMDEMSEAWNDEPDRTKGDVLDVLDWSIKRAQEDEGVR